MSPLWVMGDVHGHIDKLTDVLQGCGLVSAAGDWQGGEQRLWFLGDYFDRGPDGLAVVRLIQTLQRQAAASGGEVGALLGNHDVLINAAKRFGGAPKGDLGGRFIDNWRLNGGRDADLAGLTPEVQAWLAGLPALALVDDYLLAHADATFYLVYGQGIDSINVAITEILHGSDVKAWNRLLSYFAQRRAFTDRFRGKRRARNFLGELGGRQIVHGHTPITRLTGRDARTVTEPFVYADALCMNADPGMYMGGPGFVVNLSERV